MFFRLLSEVLELGVGERTALQRVTRGSRGIRSREIGKEDLLGLRGRCKGLVVVGKPLGVLEERLLELGFLLGDESFLTLGMSWNSERTGPDKREDQRRRDC